MTAQRSGGGVDGLSAHARVGRCSASASADGDGESAASRVPPAAGVCASGMTAKRASARAPLEDTPECPPWRMTATPGPAARQPQRQPLARGCAASRGRARAGCALSRPSPLGRAGRAACRHHAAHRSRAGSPRRAALPGARAARRREAEAAARTRGGSKSAASPSAGGLSGMRAAARGASTASSLSGRRSDGAALPAELRSAEQPRLSRPPRAAAACAGRRAPQLQQLCSRRACGSPPARDQQRRCGAQRCSAALCQETDVCARPPAARRLDAPARTA